MAYGNKIISEFGNVSGNWEDNYICDIRELNMPKGIFEVFKYCFKDIYIKNLDIFEDLYFGYSGLSLILLYIFNMHIILIVTFSLEIG